MWHHLQITYEGVRSSTVSEAVESGTILLLSWEEESTGWRSWPLEAAASLLTHQGHLHHINAPVPTTQEVNGRKMVR